MENNIEFITEIKLTLSEAIKPIGIDIIKDSAVAYQIFSENWNKDTINLISECHVLYLNRSRQVLHIYTNSIGCNTSTHIYTKLIVIGGLQVLADGFIIAVNRPSGNSKPGETDKAMKDKLKAAAECLDMKLIDYLIITPKTYYSFVDNGIF